MTLWSERSRSGPIFASIGDLRAEGTVDDSLRTSLARCMSCLPATRSGFVEDSNRCRRLCAGSARRTGGQIQRDSANESKADERMTQ